MKLIEIIPDIEECPTGLPQIDTSDLNTRYIRADLMQSFHLSSSCLFSNRAGMTWPCCFVYLNYQIASTRPPSDPLKMENIRICEWNKSPSEVVESTDKDTKSTYDSCRTITTNNRTPDCEFFSKKFDRLKNNFSDGVRKLFASSKPAVYVFSCRYSCG